MNVGIYCPDWLLAFHNTDHKVVKMFSRLNEFSNVRTEFVASKAYTMSYNLNKIAHRLAPGLPNLLKYSFRPACNQPDLIYYYGGVDRPEAFFKMVGGTPVLMTTGFMTDNFVTGVFGRLIDRQKEADGIAKLYDKASMLHFHTEGGRRRFLTYRPDFRDKTISIPFFLPNLPRFEVLRDDNTDENGRQVKLLFVGNEGKRKGLPELVQALDLLGRKYLDKYKVSVTVVSKDRPVLESGFKIDWFKKLPHSEVVNLMREASIFVLVPRLESYGLVLVEAMTAGCAIITDNDETRTEIVGETAIQIPAGSVEKLTASLRLLIEDTAYRTGLGKSAQIRSAEMFQPHIIAEKYKSCFRGLVTSSVTT